jgi:hypothetical protein
MSKLIANVHVTPPDDSDELAGGGELGGYWGPDYGNAEDVPDEIARLIPNPKAWKDSDVPFPDDEAKPKRRTRKAAALKPGDSDPEK